MTGIRLQGIRVLLAAGLAATPAFADDATDTLLTITMAEEVRSYTRAEIEAMGSETFTTTTIWTEGEQEFTGLPLVTLVDTLGVEEGTLRAYAINDYVVDIPVSDAVEGGPILAHTRNGQQMSLRNNGPLWVVYPYDSNADYQSEVIYARSIWQLDRIEIIP